MRERAERIVPQRAITVAIDSDRRTRSYGVVANISDGGACLLTDARFLLGESLQLELSFFRESEFVLASGRVVWSTGNPDTGAVRYGLQWVPTAVDGRLQGLIQQAGQVS